MLASDDYLKWTKFLQKKKKILENKQTKVKNMIKLKC